MTVGQMTSEVNNPMFLWFRKSERERIAEIDRKSIEIEKIKARELARAKTAAEALKRLNDLVEMHGISGVIYVASGAERRNAR